MYVRLREGYILHVWGQCVCVGYHHTGDWVSHDKYIVVWYVMVRSMFYKWVPSVSTVHVIVCLIWPSSKPPFQLLVTTSLHPSLCPSIIPIFMCLSIQPYIHLFCLFLCPFVSLTTHHQLIHPSFHLFICPSVCLSVCSSVQPPTHHISMIHPSFHVYVFFCL